MPPGWADAGAWPKQVYAGVPHEFAIAQMPLDMKGRRTAPQVEVQRIHTDPTNMEGGKGARISCGFSRNMAKIHPKGLFRS